MGAYHVRKQRKRQKRRSRNRRGRCNGDVHQVHAEGARGRSPKRTTLLAKRSVSVAQQGVWECGWRSRQASHLYILITGKQPSHCYCADGVLDSEDSYIRCNGRRSVSEPSPTTLTMVWKKKKKKLQKSHFSHFSQSLTFAYFLSNIHLSLVVAKNSYLAIFRQNTSSRRGRGVLTILEVVLTKNGKIFNTLPVFTTPRKTNRFENRLGLDLRSKFSDGVNEVNSEEFPPFTPSPFPPFTPSGLPYPYG